MNEEEIIVTSDKCRVVVIDVSDEYDSLGSDWSIVINPNIIKIAYCSEDFNSHEEKNIKFYISRKINFNTFIDFVKSVSFSSDENEEDDREGNRIIGFEFYERYKDDKYKDEYLKCLELTKRINSNDTSDKILSNIDYLVIKLNEIGFNIELY